MQTKRLTLIEVGVNTFTGLMGSWLITYAILHYYNEPAKAAIIITALCTIWSILRGYFIRRIFNRMLHKRS